MRVPGWFDLLVPAIAAVACGALLTRNALFIVILAVGIPVVFAMTRVAWLAYVLVLSSVATVAFYAGWPEAMGVKIPELVLAAAVVASVGILVRGGHSAVSMQNLLLILFLSATAGGILVGIHHGATLEEAVKTVRPMVFYTAFWPAFVVAADPRSRLLVMRLAAMGAMAVVGLQLAQIRVGLERPLFAFTSTVEHVVLTPQPDGFLRVRPPGLTLIYVVAIFAAAYFLWGPRRHRLLASFVGAGAALGVLLSLNRNMIIGIALGLTVSALVVPRRNRFLVIALVSVLLIVASLSLWEAQRHEGATGSVVQRVLSIGQVSELRSGTLSDRSYENRFAVQVLRDEPLTGIGWGPPYGARLIEFRDGRLVREPRQFLHQQYLWIWMRSGLVGLIALLSLLGLALSSAARWSRKRAWDDRSWLGPAVLASGCALVASANVGTYLTNPDSIVILVGVLALGYALAAESRSSERQAEK